MTQKTLKAAIGISTTLSPGQEQHKRFTHKKGAMTRFYYQYDYRHTDGELFSCVKLTLPECRAARNDWLAKKEATTWTNL